MCSIALPGAARLLFDSGLQAFQRGLGPCSFELKAQRFRSLSVQAPTTAYLSCLEKLICCFGQRHLVGFLLWKSSQPDF